jgi:hypothetical protein
METNPYAPPKAPVADWDPSATGHKRRRVIVMILLLLVTFGLYYPAWFFRRRTGLNRLNSPRKLALWPLAVYAGYFVVEFVVGLMTAERSLEDAIGSAGTLVLAMTRLGVSVLMWVQCFIIKDMLEDHVSSQSDDGSRALFAQRVSFSGLMTFFFTIFYLQHLINRHIVSAKAAQ